MGALVLLLLLIATLGACPLVGLVLGESHAKGAAFCDAVPVESLDLSSPSNLLARRGTHLFRRNNKQRVVQKLIRLEVSKDRPSALCSRFTDPIGFRVARSWFRAERARIFGHS